MASERQVAANRRNAQKSTGPKTALGKKRSSKNAYRHGLSLPMSNIGSQEQLKEFIDIFAGDTSNLLLGWAERAADARADLLRVRKAKSAMFERALIQTKGDNFECSRPPLVCNQGEEQQFLDAILHILPELVRISRYEKRAASREARAIHKLASRKSPTKR